MSELSTEQQFAIASFRIFASKLSREEAQARLVELYTANLAMDTYYKELLKHEWGMVPPAS